jgi:hypothetical protein
MRWPVRSGEARTPAVEINCPRSSAELRSPTRVYWLDANAIFGSLNALNLQLLPKKGMDQSLSACGRGRTDRVADNGPALLTVVGPPHRSGNVHRSRHALNADTIREMHLAFQRGGRAAILKVMKQQPAAFLKLLVLLVPRELEVTHSGGVKSLTDQQLEEAAIKLMLAARADGSSAQVIEGIIEPDLRTLPNHRARKAGGNQEMTTSEDVGQDLGQDGTTPETLT